ncbi:PKD domain-containing protein, partial [uncultured Friedmanniella sp.]|uniref:PKD domain-containing protein n=1 Tax=uncultured Friedmanniella sp. TaxID=335381 RepID=UPI0035CACEF7
MAFSPSLVRRGFTSLLSTAVLAAGLVVLADAPASAATDAGYNVVDRNSTTGVTADALPTAQIDGVAWDQAIVGDTVYVGGQFTNVRPAGAAAGVSTSPRSNLLSYNIKTGVFDPGFAPTVNGRIRAMAVSPDKSRLYIVGSFTSVNGLSRSRVAAFNTADGSLVSSFAPVAGSDVFSIAVSNSAVYLGGYFTTMNGVARTRLAAVSPTNGSTLAWAPTADSTVQAMTLTPDKSRLIVGGAFANLNGSTAPGLGSLDASNAVLYPFAANTVIQDYGTSASIWSLKADDTNIYGTGYWFGGTGNFEGMFEADPLSGAIKTMADCHGDSYDVSPANGVIYTVSHSHDCTNMNGFPDTNPRNRWQRANAYTMDATTTTGPNNAGGYYSFQGQPSSSIINWYPEVASGTYTGQSQGGWTTEATSSYVVQGGEFPTVNGTAQQGLVRFAIPSLATNKQGPIGKTAESAPSLRGISGTSVRVSWLANYDRDDSKLTYKLYRSGTTTPIETRTVASEFWNRPTQIFTDTGLTNGKSYSYYVTATDASGNTAKSGTTSITTGSAVVDNSAYSQAVTNDGATHYWRLNEAAGQTKSVDWVGGNDLVLGAGVTNGAAGAIAGSPDTAATFSGTDTGVAGQTSTETGPNTFSAEAWFSTTSTSGGKIIGFGGNQTTDSGSYDRQVYLDNSGHLTFGVYPNAVRTVTTSGTYNDGKYHHVVASLSSAGMKLYVDGLLQGSDPGTTSAQAYTGYWRVGGDNLNGWPGQLSSNKLAGTIDDVAIYPTALTLTQIRDHYTRSGRTVDLPPAPTDTYGKQVVGDSPLFFWRLNETNGSTVADATENKVAGNVYGGVTLGTSSDVAPGTSAGFDGSTGTLASATAFNNPTTYSEEVWFKTTTTNGGKLIGFGDQQSGYSGNYDRHVYMENSGQLTYGVWTGQANTITSPTAYNNGTWHHLVATQDGTAGMKMYVDGVLVGTNPQTSNQSYNGYWRVGGDTSWGGNSSFFNGNLDEAAVYGYALTATQVKAHYSASPAAVNAAPVASFTTSCTDATCYVDGSASTDDGSVAGYAWDFGDGGSATGSTATHTYSTSGTYTVSLTVTDDKGVKTTTTKSVTATVPVPNQAPTAAYTSTCTELVCAFDSSTSADADGTIASYAWTFGDGNTSAEPSPSHTYAANGSYTAALTVTDNKGATNTVTHTVTVARNNVAPVASFTANPTGLKVAVDGSASADSDGTVASYAWSYGDGG